MTYGRHLIVALSIAAAQLGSAAAVESPDSSGAQKLPSFQRVYVPQAEIGKHSWGAGYLPLDTHEFERLLEAAQAAAEGAPAPGAPELVRARLNAHLAGDDVLLGTAELEIRANGSETKLLSLSPFNLALGPAVWSDKDSHRAVVGPARDGQMRVQVDGSTLAFEWSLRGERLASGAVRFHLELPKCPATEITVTAPAGTELSIDRGLASRTDEAGETQWKLELGGSGICDVRMTPASVARERRPLTLLRQIVTYEVSTRGVGVNAQLKLDVHGEPIERIAVDLDPDLRLVSARYGEQELAWSATADPESRLSHVTIQLPEPVAGTGRVVQLVAIAPLVTGREWRLPGLRTLGMSWQEGTAELLVPSLFVMDRLAMSGCRQSRIAPLPAPLAGESVEIQYFRPGGTIDLVLDQPRERPKTELGSMLELGANQVTSTATISFSLVRAHRKTMQLDVRPGWIIDSVESADTERGLQWELEETSADKVRLKIQFSVGIGPENAARVIVRGHRQSNGAEPRTLSDFEMLSLDTFERGARLINVRAADGWELRWQGFEDLARRDPLKLSPAEARLFVQPPTSSVILIEPTANQATVSLERVKPTFAGNIRVDAAVQGNTLTETYAIECTPQGRVERLLIHFSDKRESPLEWSLAGGNSGQFSARRLSAGEQARISGPAGGEVWEVNVRLTRSGPFELRAVRSTMWMGDIAVALASLIDATSQRGSVAVRALTDTGITITNRGLAPVPPELLGKDHYQTARGAYHYEPAREAAGPLPQLSIAPGPMAGGQSAWAWNCRLESRYASDALTVHWAVLDIEIAGREHIAATLPDGTELKSIFVNGESLAAVPSPAGTLDISLPHGRAFATLALQYTALGSLPGFVASATPVVPKFDIPVLQYDWTVWLPPGFAIVDHDGRLPSDAVLAPSFSQRIFGLLGRTTREKLFNPLSVSEWRAVFRTSDSQPARQVVEHFLHDLDAAIANHCAGEPITWAQLLGASEPAEDAANRILLVDELALDFVGISAFAAVNFPSLATTRPSAITLLETNRLVLLATGNTVVLTSAAAAAGETCQLEPTGERAFVIAPGPLADEVARAPQQHESIRFELLAAWLSHTDHFAPQAGQELALRASADPHDWSAHRVVFRGAAAPVLRIVRTSAMNSLAWAVFLAMAAVGSWKSICSTRALVVCIAISACAALLLPTTYAVLASAALLSALFCLALRVTRAVPPGHLDTDASRGSRESRSSIHEVARAVVLIAVLGFAWNAQAQPPRAAPPTVSPDAASAGAANGKGELRLSTAGARSEPGNQELAAESSGKKRDPATYKVLVPTDEDMKAIEGKYYVPAELFRRLTVQAQQSSPLPRGWLISRAVYQGALARDPSRHRLGLSSLRASFDVQVFEEQRTIELPLSRASVSNTPAAVRVDGRVIPVVWNGAGTTLVFNSMSADRHRVEVELTALPQSDAPLSGFDVLIPKLANSILELAVPADAPPLELPGANGEIHFDKERGQLKAHLGPSERLSVRWSTPSGPETASPNLEVEELMWMKVRPGTTVVDARFKYKVLSGRVQQLRLLTDPRLRALPPTSSTSPVAAMHTVPGEPQRIEIELKRPVVDQVTLELSFLVTNTSGVGNLRLPRLESSQARATRRWLAASVDPALQPKIQAGEDSRTIELAEFAAAWGDAEASPQAAFAIPRGEPIWVLATQPSEPRVTVEQVTALSLGRNVSLLDYEAQLSITGGHVFQLRLKGFPGLTVERVSLLEDELQRVARFSVGEDGLITVFLNAALDGQQRLTLRGRWETAGKNSLAAPQLQVMGADTRKCQLQVFRQASVLVEMQKEPGVVASEVPPAADREGFGAFVAALNLDKPDSPIQLSIAHNPTRARAVCVTYLRHEGNRWVADFDCRLEVMEGLLDTIQLSVPPQWSEPFSIEPAARSRLNPALGDTRAQLVIQPDKPLSGKHRFVIRGRVALSAGDRLRVPDIVPLRVQELERFVVLPDQLEHQPVAWDTFRLNRAALPGDLVEGGLKGEGLSSYHVAGERFQATLKAVQRNEAKPRVSLADIQIAWQGDGSCSGVALFDVLANGASTCNLEMPEDCQLIQASIDGAPALLSDVGTQPIQLQLASRQLPQRVQILFTSRWTGSSTHRRFVAPRLTGVTVDRTLWSVFGPRAFGGGHAQTAEHATGSDHDLYRLKSISSLVQLAPETLGEHLPEEISRWYVAWKERYAMSHVAYDRAQSRGQSVVTKAADIDLVELDKAFTAVDARLGGVLTPEIGAAENIERLSVQDLVCTRATHAGAQDHVDIRYASSVAMSYWPRLLSALFVVGLAVAAVMVLPTTLPTFAPATVVAAGGLLWWLFLAPSGLGLAAAVVAGWFALRGRRKVRALSFPR